MKHKFFLSLLLALLPLFLLAQLPVTRSSTKPKAKPKTEQAAKPSSAKKTNQTAKPSAGQRTNAASTSASSSRQSISSQTSSAASTSASSSRQSISSQTSSAASTSASSSHQSISSQTSSAASTSASSSRQSISSQTSSAASSSASSSHQTILSQTFTVNGVSFDMMYVEGGTFTMGATSEQGSEAESDEKLTHRVTLSSFYIGKYEVTQALWKAVMDSNPSKWKGDNFPVVNVSWDDCQTFIRKLNALTGKNFRLPTEAEWEFAARGGNNSRGYKYSGSNNIGDVAWYKGNSGRKTHAVGTKSPNELGIYDMSGNVCEWCQDRYGSYSSASQTNPTGASSGSARVLRGGSWYYFARYCRSSDRYCLTPDYRYIYFGLRLVLSQL